MQIFGQRGSRARLQSNSKRAQMAAFARQAAQTADAERAERKRLAKEVLELQREKSRAALESSKGGLFNRVKQFFRRRSA